MPSCPKCGAKYKTRKGKASCKRHGPLKTQKYNVVNGKHVEYDSIEVIFERLNKNE